MFGKQSKGRKLENQKTVAQKVEKALDNLGHITIWYITNQVVGALVAILGGMAAASLFWSTMVGIAWTLPFGFGGLVVALDFVWLGLKRMKLTWNEMQLIRMIGLHAQVETDNEKQKLEFVIAKLEYQIELDHNPELKIRKAVEWLVKLWKELRKP